MLLRASFNDLHFFNLEDKKVSKLSTLKSALLLKDVKILQATSCYVAHAIARWLGQQRGAVVCVCECIHYPWLCRPA